MTMPVPQTREDANAHKEAVDRVRVHELWEGATAPGGHFRVRPRTDYPEHHAVVWVPTRTELRSLDLEEYSINEAGIQTARYALPGYEEIRFRFEAMLTELQGAGITPYIELDTTDSANVGADVLTIDVDDSGRGEPILRIIYETNVMPQDIEPGEAPAESYRHDVSEMTPAAFVAFVKRQHDIR